MSLWPLTKVILAHPRSSPLPAWLDLISLSGPFLPHLQVVLWVFKTLPCSPATVCLECILTVLHTTALQS